MKKRNILIVLAGLILSALIMSPVLGAQSQQDVEVQINGVKVYGEGTHRIQDQVWVDAIGYAELLEREYTFVEGKSKFTIDGSTLEVKMYKSRPAVEVSAIANATGARNVDWDQEEKLAYVLYLPEGVINVDGPQDVYAPGIPGMGAHWARLEDLPLGPIYGIEKGKLVFIEQMVSQADFNNGVSHVDIPGMRGLPSPAVNHANIEFVPNGHPGFEIPHYDLHQYFVTPEERATFSPAEDGHTGHSH